MSICLRTKATGGVISTYSTFLALVILAGRVIRVLALLISDSKVRAVTSALIALSLLCLPAVSNKIISNRFLSACLTVS